VGTHRAHKKVSNVFERTIISAVAFLKESVSNDAFASQRGFLQSRDPRCKCLSLFLLLLCVLITRSIPELGIIYLVTLALAAVSAIPLQAFFKRTLLFIPIFSLCIVIPAMFNIVTPGDALCSMTLWEYTLSITRQGLDSATIFFLRVLVSVSLSVLVVLTTRHHELLKVLRVFRVPQIFVMIMGMTYRYIYLLLDIAQNTFIAVKSRVGFALSGKTGRSIITANMAGLWLKSYRLHTQVHAAMLSRGFSGEPQVYNEFTLRTIDLGMLVCAIIVGLGTLWLNYSMR
jgi:cobalt/nickel transport system permease protein